MSDPEILDYIKMVAEPTKGRRAPHSGPAPLCVGCRGDELYGAYPRLAPVRKEGEFTPEISSHLSPRQQFELAHMRSLAAGIRKDSVAYRHPLRAHRMGWSGRR